MSETGISTPSGSPGSLHFRDLDGVRGVLALAVAILHFGFNGFIHRTFGWDGFRFQLAVDVFFLLSGYVLTYSARRGVTLSDFAIKRFVRLAPVFYVTTALTLVFVPEGWRSAELIMAVPFSGVDPVNFPAWSVCWELYLPVLAVLMPVHIPGSWVRPLLGVMLVALALADIGVANGQSLYLMRAFCGLGAGHLLYRANLDFVAPLVPLFCVLITIKALAAAFPVAAFMLPFVASLCVIAGRRDGTLFTSPPVQFLGYISYTLYLVHIPVLRAMQRGMGDGAVDHNPLAKLGGLATAIVLAWFLTTLVERPCMRLGQQWLRARSSTS